MEMPAVDVLPVPNSAPWTRRLRARLHAWLSGDSGRWRLQNAIIRHDVDTFDACIRLGLLPDEPPYRPERLLPLVIGHPSSDRFIARLCALGADLNQEQEGFGCRPWLNCAAYAGDEAAVHALLAAGADVTLRDGASETPALAALRRVAEVDPRSPAVGQQDVARAWRIVEACLRAGCPAAATDDQGNSLFSYALLDTPHRLTWVLQQPGVRDWVQGRTEGVAPAHASRSWSRGQTPPAFRLRAALETVLFSNVEGTGQPWALRTANSLVAHRTGGASICYARQAIIAILDTLGTDYRGVDAEGRTLLEAGIACAGLRARDVPFLVARGAPLAVTDAHGNTLTHQLATRQEYANPPGRTLLDVLHRAGLPDQRAVQNAAGLTPIECRNRFVDTWYGANLLALQRELEPRRQEAPRRAPGVHIRHPVRLRR